MKCKECKDFDNKTNRCLKIRDDISPRLMETDLENECVDLMTDKEFNFSCKSCLLKAIIIGIYSILSLKYDISSFQDAKFRSYTSL